MGTISIRRAGKVSVLKRSDKVIDYTMRTVIIIITVMASLTMLLQVITRYIFNIAIPGLDEMTGHTAVWMYLMGAAYGAYDRSQIKADMINMFIKNERVLNVFRTVASLVAIFVAGNMVVWSYGYVRWSIFKHEVTPTLQWPTVIFQFSILIGSVLMMYYFIREMLDHARGALRCNSSSCVELALEKGEAA